MKKVLTFISFNSLLIFSLSLFFSCSEKQDNFVKYEWFYNSIVYDEDYTNSTYQQETWFKNDSAVSFSELTGKTIKFPLIKKDSLIIFDELVTIKGKGEKKKETTSTNSFLFDFKKMFGKPLLIVKQLETEYHFVLTTSKDNIEFEETNNFLSIINFKVGGVQIGDSISLKNIQSKKYSETIDDINIIEGTLINNNNLEVQIIDKKYVYKITQKNIERNYIENIIKVINDKIKIKPDTIKKSKPFYVEGFKWESNGVNIKLTKRDMYQYLKDKSEDKKQSDEKREFYRKHSIRQIGKPIFYRLEYDNSLLQNILSTIATKKIQSSIIE